LTSPKGWGKQETNLTPRGTNPNEKRGQPQRKSQRGLGEAGCFPSGEPKKKTTDPCQPMVGSK